MKLVIHISDPHFGEEHPAIAATLLAELNALRPALIAISGDLTGRGRRSHFRAARDWLKLHPLPTMPEPIRVAA